MIEDLPYVKLGVAAVEAEGFDVVEAAHVGSKYITDGRGMDYDVLILVKKREFQSGIAQHAFEDSSWAYGGSDPTGLDISCEHWGSWKKDVDGETVNIICTENVEWYWNFIKAAEICRYINLVQNHKEATALPSLCEVGQRKGHAYEWELRYGIHNILMEDAVADHELERFKKEGK